MEYNIIKDLTFEAIILHILGNDIEKKQPEECINELEILIKRIREKELCSKIIVSLGTPKKDVVKHRKVEMLNILIKDKFVKDGDIFLCDNSNLSFRGRPDSGILVNDGKHLTKKGTYMLTGNLKEAIVEHLGLRDNRNRRRSGGKTWTDYTSGHRNFGYYKRWR